MQDSPARTASQNKTAFLIVREADGELGVLLFQPGTKGMQRRDVITDDLHRTRERYGEDQAHGTPDPAPDEERDEHHKGVQLEALANHFRKQYADRKHV